MSPCASPSYRPTKCISRRSGQSENVQRLAALRDLDLWRELRGSDSRAAAAESGHHRDVLFSVDAVSHREALNRRAQACFPEHLPGLHIQNVDASIDVTDQHPSARGRKRGSKKRRALLVLPHLIHALHVVRGELADVAVAARHRLEDSVAAI